MQAGSVRYFENAKVKDEVGVFYWSFWYIRFLKSIILNDDLSISDIVSERPSTKKPLGLRAAVNFFCIVFWTSGEK